MKITKKQKIKEENPDKRKQVSKDESDQCFVHSNHLNISKKRGKYYISIDFNRICSVFQIKSGLQEFSLLQI